MAGPMIAKVTGVTPGGWWTLKPIDGHNNAITLMTFMVPRDIRYGDEIHLKRIGGLRGFFRVTKIIRRVRQYGRRKQERS